MGIICMLSFFIILEKVKNIYTIQWGEGIHILFLFFIQYFPMSLYCRKKGGADESNYLSISNPSEDDKKIKEPSSVQ